MKYQITITFDSKKKITPAGIDELSSNIAWHVIEELNRKFSANIEEVGIDARDFPATQKSAAKKPAAKKKTASKKKTAAKKRS